MILLKLQTQLNSLLQNEGSIRKTYYSFTFVAGGCLLYHHTPNQRLPPWLKIIEFGWKNYGFLLQRGFFLLCIHIIMYIYLKENIWFLYNQRIWVIGILRRTALVTFCQRKESLLKCSTGLPSKCNFNIHRNF